jgi:hypothetical protein
MHLRVEGQNGMMTHGIWGTWREDIPRPGAQHHLTPAYKESLPWAAGVVRFAQSPPVARLAHARIEDLMSEEDLKAELARLKAENEQLKSQRGRAVSLKVSEKGGVSVYGLGRFPVTLYKEQWTKLLSMADEIRAFIKENDANLKTKPEG